MKKLRQKYNSFKIIELIRGKVWVQTKTVWLQKVHSSPFCVILTLKDQWNIQVDIQQVAMKLVLCLGGFKTVDADNGQGWSHGNTWSYKSKECKKRKEGKGKELTAYSFNGVVLQSKRRKETQRKNSHKNGRIHRVMDTPAYFWLRFWFNFPIWRPPSRPKDKVNKDTCPSTRTILSQDGLFV